MRRLLCLSLALFLFLSSPLFVLATEVTDPTVAPAPDLSETAIPVAVEANSAIASALIGAGVQPGTNLDDFNMLVSSCVTAMESEGMFMDGKIAFVSNNVDGVQYMYAPVHLIDAVRNWLLDDSGAVSENYGSSFSFNLSGTSYNVEVRYGSAYLVAFRYWLTNGNFSNSVYLISPYSFDFRIQQGTSSFGVWIDSKLSGVNHYGQVYSSVSYSAAREVILDISGVPYFFIGTFASASDARTYIFENFLTPIYSSSLDVYLSDLSSSGYSSWLGTSVDYDGATFVPCSVMNTYDDTIQLPQEYVQGGITDYTPPAPPDVTVPDWESPDVPQYPGSESAPPDNELLWGIRVAVSETIPYWIKTTSGSIVEWLQRIYNHITDTVAGLVGVLSTQHDALLAKLDELKAGFGGESSAGDELQSEVDRVDSELDEMTDIMNSVTRPDVDSIDTDISEHIDQANLTLLATPFTAMMTEGPFSTMVFITLTLVLCAYVLYGKR